jgi:hypothetical protein
VLVCPLRVEQMPDGYYIFKTPLCASGLSLCYLLKKKKHSLGDPSILKLLCVNANKSLDLFAKCWLFSLCRRYILWVSSVVQRFSSEKACLHLLNLNESVSLSVTLEYDGSSTTIFDQPVDEGNFYACADFKVRHAFLTFLFNNKS